MEKKRSVGVTVFSIIYALLGFCLFFYNLSHSNLLPPDSRVIGVISYIVAILLLTSAMLLFKLNRWGYRLAILVMLPGLLFLFPLIIAHIYFFTRPKVKEQFR